MPTEPAVLPPLYARWMRSMLPKPIASESEATCDDCAMCPGGGETLLDADEFFRPDAKCCSFYPELPNFLAGRLLADEDPAAAHGKATVEARIDAGLAVSPLGLARPAVERVLYDAADPGAFGKNTALICPHYVNDGGLCAIWKSRNHVCSTWFCKHVRGAVGGRFWDSMRLLLGRVEQTLSHWCALQMDLDVDALFALTDAEHTAPLDAAALDGRPDQRTLRKVWGTWLGREREFYLACAKLVEELTWDRVIEIGGPDLEIAARVALRDHAKTTATTLPERLVSGEFQVKPLPDGMVRITSYRPHDPLALPAAVLDVLPYFDGRPVTDSLRDIKEQAGIDVEAEFILQLVDFDVLISPPEAD